MEKIRTVVVLAGGESVAAGPRLPVTDTDLVIAADSGVHHARALGLHVDLVVGDLDSVDARELDAVVEAGATVERHPVDKDATDLELALHAAVDRGAERIVVLGAGGGRFDHFLANVLVLASPAFAGARVEALVGAARVVVVHDKAVVDGEPGDLLTLLPVGGPAEGVRTTGLRFALDGERLDAGTTRGVSNELTGNQATITVDGGVLLVVQP
ncbi:MAG TPA: thiamine diphosphokinase [Acidimicrobiales bacterium]|jgi:thiamine pyrophosphokinase|nr:thiamine diphosphokinase [Acidimicrobiales bacterium]